MVLLTRTISLAAGFQRNCGCDQLLMAIDSYNTPDQHKLQYGRAARIYDSK